ncbi:unnamed protein product [Absidia cylindrospora]
MKHYDRETSARSAIANDERNTGITEHNGSGISSSTIWYVDVVTILVVLVDWCTFSPLMSQDKNWISDTRGLRYLY